MNKISKIAINSGGQIEEYELGGNSSVFIATDEGGVIREEAEGKAASGGAMLSQLGFAILQGTVTGLGTIAINGGFAEGCTINAYPHTVLIISAAGRYTTIENDYDIKENYAVSVVYKEGDDEAYQITHLEEDSEGHLLIDTAGKGSWQDGDTLIVFHVGSLGVASHSEGSDTVTIGLASHSEGWNTKALDDAAHAEGISTYSTGRGSHAEGSGTFAAGQSSHAEGFGNNYFDPINYTIFVKQSSSGTDSYGNDWFITDCSPSDNWVGSYFNTSEGRYQIKKTEKVDNGYKVSFWPNTFSWDSLRFCKYITIIPEGAIGDYSHTEGITTTAINNGEHAEGINNISIPDHTISSIGIGSMYNSDEKANAFLVTYDGSVYIKDIGGFDGTNSHILDDEGRRYIADSNVLSILLVINSLGTPVTKVSLLENDANFVTQDDLAGINAILENLINNE